MYTQIQLNPKSSQFISITWSQIEISQIPLGQKKMRNIGFRISSWTGQCAGSAGFRLIGRQLKFQLSSSFNLLEKCCTTLVSVGSENILKQLHSCSAWSKEHGFQTPNTQVGVHQSLASPFMVPTLFLFVMWALLAGTNPQAMQQTNTSKF